MRNNRLLVLLCLVGQANAALAQEQAPSTVVIRNVNVIPMNSERVLQGYSVVVENGRISRVSANDEGPRGALVIDGTGRYLMPGLVDMHVHLRAESELLSYLIYGVTTIVNLSGASGNAPDPLDVRSRIGEGSLLGPSLYTSGPILDGNPPIFKAVSTVVTSAEEAKRIVSLQSKAGYDFIKVYNNLQPSILNAVTTTARNQRMAVFGHIPRMGERKDALQGALKAGIHVIAHGEEYFFTYFNDGVDSLLDRGITPIRKKQDIPMAAQLTADAGTAVILNLSSLAMTRSLLSKPGRIMQNPEFQFLSPEVRDMWRKRDPSKRQDQSRFDRLQRALFPFIRSLTKGLKNAGVSLLLGTDSSAPGLYPGQSAHRELFEMILAGLTHYEALRTATANAGSFLHRHAPRGAAFGVIAEGTRADLLLIRGNPLADVRNASLIDGVMVAGRWFTVKELKEKRSRIVGQ